MMREIIKAFFKLLFFMMMGWLGAYLSGVRCPPTQRLPGPAVDVVSVSIFATDGSRECLALDVVLIDDRGVAYYSPPFACSSFAVMLDPGASLLDVDVLTSRPHTIEIGVDKGR